MTPAVSYRRWALLLLWGPMPLLVLWSVVAPSRELRLLGFGIYLMLTAIGWAIVAPSRPLRLAGFVVCVVLIAATLFLALQPGRAPQ